MTGNSALGAMFGATNVDTFMGLPRSRDLSRLSAKMALIGADGCTPYQSVGFYCAGGPAAIRAAGAAYAARALRDESCRGAEAWRCWRRASREPHRREAPPCCVRPAFPRRNVPRAWLPAYFVQARRDRLPKRATLVW